MNSSKCEHRAFSKFKSMHPISLDLQEQIQTIISKSKSNISSFAFGNLYLFRKKYDFKVSISETTLITAGIDGKGRTFFSIFGELPPKEKIDELLEKYRFWKGISEEKAKMLNATEDRDNFEYIYLRTDLAELPGKNFQKKRNLVNAFIKAHPHRETKILDKNTLKDAMQVLNEWGKRADYDAAKEGLELHEALGFSGLVFYVDGNPVGYCQGEALADGESFAVHFEKALDKYKGVYQYINQEFAKTVPDNIIYINREQDLGDEGLRQAKLTYRPFGFVKLFSIKVSTKAT